MNIEGTGSGPYRMRLVPQFVGGADEYKDGTGTAFSLGAWHRIEWLYDSVTGAAKVWQDGELVISATFTTGSAATGFYVAQIYPGWGGGGGVKTQEDFYWYGHIHISGIP